MNEKLSPGHGLLVELIITFQLLFTICASCDSKRDNITGSVALAIGFSVAIGHLFAVSITTIVDILLEHVVIWVKHYRKYVLGPIHTYSL